MSEKPNEVTAVVVPISKQTETVLPPITDLERDAEEMALLVTELSDFTPSDAAQIAQFGEWLSDIKARAAGTRERMEAITKPLREGLESARALFTPTLEAYDRAEQALKRAILDGRAAIEMQNRAAVAAMAEAAESGTSLALPLQNAALPEGVHTRSKWTYTVVNLDLVPREFLTLDPKKVRAWLSKQERAELVEIPGLLVKREEVVVARGSNGKAES